MDYFIRLSFVFALLLLVGCGGGGGASHDDCSELGPSGPCVDENAPVEPEKR